VLNDYEQASLIFAGQSHNGLTAHAEALEKRYQEVLQATIDLKLDWERANALTRDVRHNLELCLGLVFEKLAAAKAIGSTSSSSLRPGYMVPQLQIGNSFLLANAQASANRKLQSQSKETARVPSAGNAPIYL